MYHRFFALCLISGSLLLYPFNVLADDEQGVLGFIVENDLFAGSDRDYTSGVRMSWVSREGDMPTWVQSVADILPLASEGQKRIAVALGQSMYAPEDITRTVPAVDEHPYAGWLYGSVGIVSDTGKTLDNVMLTLGVVGPLAYAEQTQNFVHRVVGSNKARGWDYQLENEPGIILTYERKWRNAYAFSPLGFNADITPHAGVNLGNVTTDATVGATLRLGYNLPADYGPPRIRPSLPGSDFFVPTKQLGGYLFATLGERIVARNIFLDGNTFGNSASVDKKPLVTSLQTGMTLTYDTIRLSYTHVFMTKEYKTQRNMPQFGVLTLSYRF